MRKSLKDPSPFKVIGGKVTVDQAAWMTGKSNQAIYNAIKDGRMTADIDERDGKSVKVIQLTDLERLYQNLRYPGQTSQDNEASVGVSPQPNGGGLDTSKFLELMEKRFKDQLQQYEQEVDYLRKANEKSQDAVNNITRLLEDHRQRDEKSQEMVEQKDKNKEEELLRRMSTMMKKQESERLSQEKRMQSVILQLRKENKRILVEMHKEKQKGLWQRLFGG
jgi:vacuolar-type H+-ATPase subunit I/STV1